MKPSERLARERMSVPLLVVLTIITLGFYSPIWFWQRSGFFTKAGRVKFPLGLVYVLAAVEALGLFVTVGTLLGGASAEAELGSNLITIISGICSLILAFRGRDAIVAYCSRIGRPRRMSGAGTFFFNIYYLQYHINRAAEDAERKFGSEHGVDPSVFD